MDTNPQKPRRSDHVVMGVLLVVVLAFSVLIPNSNGVTPFGTILSPAWTRIASVAFVVVGGAAFLWLRRRRK